MTPRLSARVWTSALLRRVHAGGGFGVVLHRGDDVAGSVVIVHRHGRIVRALQRRLSDDGSYQWSIAAAQESVDAWVAKQRGYDPDLWVIELDTPDVARFIDETTLPS